MAVGDPPLVARNVGAELAVERSKPLRMARLGAEIERPVDLRVANEVAGAPKRSQGERGFLAYLARIPVRLEKGTEGPAFSVGALVEHVVERKGDICDVPVVAAVIEVNRAQLPVPEEVVELVVAVDQAVGDFVPLETGECRADVLELATNRLQPGRERFDQQVVVDGEPRRPRPSRVRSQSGVEPVEGLPPRACAALVEVARLELDARSPRKTTAWKSPKSVPE